MNTNGYQLPVYVAKGVYTSGHIADIGPLQVGIIDRNTNYVATATGNGKEFLIAGGSMHTTDQLNKWYSGRKQAKKSEIFRGSDIVSFEKALPKRPQNEQWVVGYDGSKTSATLAFEPGKTYQLKISLFGEPVYKYWNGKLERVISLYTGCLPEDDDCTQSCADVKLGVKTQTLAWVKAINNHPDLREFKLKAYPVFSDATATASTIYKYTLKVVDSGDVGALQTVQRQYPANYKIKQLSYSRGVSTYVTDYISAAPTAFQPQSFVYIPDCGACQGSDTLVPSYDLYAVRRQLASSTDLDDATARTNYVAQVVTDYGGVTGSGVYGGIKAGEATVAFKHAHTDTPAGPLNSDVIERTGTTQAVCVGTTPATVAWAQSTGGYVQTRTLTITLPNEDCNVPTTVAQVQGSLSSVQGIGTVTDVTDNTGTGIDADHCVKVFQVTQTSNVMSDLYCMTKDVVDYKPLPGFRGFSWTEVIVDEPYDPTIKAGIRLVAPFYRQQFGIDSYDVNEYYDIMPLQMEVSIWTQDLQPCQFDQLVKARRTVGVAYSRLNGDYVLNNYINRNRAYFVYEMWENTPRGREVIDVNTLSQIKREAYYVAYYFKYRSLKDKQNFHQHSEDFETIIYVDEADKATQDALEAAFLAISSKHGVYLANRG